GRGGPCGAGRQHGREPAHGTLRGLVPTGPPVSRRSLRHIRKEVQDRTAHGADPPRRPWLGAALVLAASMLWATLGIFAKRLYAAGLTPLELASVRASVAVVGLVPWMLA